MSWYFLNISQIAQRNDFPKIILKETRQLPIFPIDQSAHQEKNYKIINDFVDKIISARKINSEAEINLWEKHINKAIYELYDLTEDEIKIIEQR